MGGLLWDESDVFDGISSRACAVRGCDVFELPAPWGPEQESAASALGVGAAGAPAPAAGSAEQPQSQFGLKGCGILAAGSES